MGQLTSYMLGGLAAMASWSMVAPPDSGGGIPSISAAFQAAEQGTEPTVNRTRKGDRMAPPQATEQKTVTAIEVVGVRDAAIIYRDRDGNVLYRTDPMSNVTVIAKGVKLPDITVRQDLGSAPRPIPIRVPEKTGSDAPKSKALPIGCEPAASPVASPQLSHLTGHCISQADRTIEVARLD